jgi:hypothetical protein
MTTANVPWPDADWLQRLDRADAVFRPDATRAGERGMTSIWSGEIVLHDIGLKRRAFADAPRDEQMERLGETLETTLSRLGDPGSKRCRYFVSLLFQGAPIALHHKVECLAGDRTIPLGTASGARGTWISVNELIDVDESADPISAVAFRFTPIEPPGDDAPDGAWRESFTIDDVVIASGP